MHSTEVMGFRITPGRTGPEPRHRRADYGWQKKNPGGFRRGSSSLNRQPGEAQVAAGSSEVRFPCCEVFQYGSLIRTGRGRPGKEVLDPVQLECSCNTG